MAETVGEGHAGGTCARPSIKGLRDFFAKTFRPPIPPSEPPIGSHYWRVWKRTRGRGAWRPRRGTAFGRIARLRGALGKDFGRKAKAAPFSPQEKQTFTGTYGELFQRSARAMWRYTGRAGTAGANDNVVSELTTASG